MKFKPDKRGNVVVPVDRDGAEYISCQWISSTGLKRYNVNHHVTPRTARCVYCKDRILQPGALP